MKKEKKINLNNSGSKIIKKAFFLFAARQNYIKDFIYKKKSFEFYVFVFISQDQRHKST